MEAEARYTWVGAAVLALLAALVGSVLWLKDIGGRDAFQRYAIHFERQALDGLDVGGEVKLRGIKIGRVEDFALSHGKLNRVRVEVRVDKRAPIRTNTVAVIMRNVVTDIAAIELVTPEPPGPPLTDAPPGERLPVIGEGGSEFDELSVRVTRLGELAAVTLNNLNQLLSAENRQAVMAAVHQLRDLSAGLNQRLAGLDRTLARSGSAAHEVGGAAKQIGGAAQEVGSAAARLGDAGERAVATVQRTGERLDATLAETERTLAEARRAIEQIGSAASAVQQQALRTAQRLEDSASNVDDQLSATVAELRTGIAAATRALERLRDPRAALLGPGAAQLGPGEHRP
jgi:phospholipid/cholesterol/gamma-HCH transport system substrate-binding protein